MAASLQLVASLALQVPAATGTGNFLEHKLNADAGFSAQTDTVTQIEIVPNDAISGDPQTIEIQLNAGYTALTPDHTAEKFGAAAHGFENGQPGKLSATVIPAGLTADLLYYIVNKTTNDFQLALTVGGAAQTFTNNGTAVLFRPVGEIDLTYPYHTPAVPIIVRNPSGAPFDFKKIRALQIVLRARNIAANALGTVQITAGDPADKYGHFNIPLKLNFTASGAEVWPSATVVLPEGFDYDAGWHLTVRTKEGEANTNLLLLIDLLGF